MSNSVNFLLLNSVSDTDFPTSVKTLVKKVSFPASNKAYNTGLLLSSTFSEASVGSCTNQVFVVKKKKKNASLIYLIPPFFLYLKHQRQSQIYEENNLLVS